jgi:polyhydroxybutyrate depolymerase
MQFWTRTPYSRRSIIAIALLTCLLGSGCGSAVAARPSLSETPALPSASCPAGDSYQQIESGGVVREYRIHVPPSAGTDGSTALVLGFHGNGGSADGFAGYSGFLSVSDREGFIMVYPQGAGAFPSWEMNPVENNADVQFIRDLIAELEARCSVDPDRIYATGHSRGGGMANRLGCDLSDRIAAIGPVSGTYPVEDPCHISRPVSVIAFHGSADQDVPYNGIKDQSGPPDAYFAFGIPILQWATGWAARDGCASESASILKETYLTGLAWSGCRGGAEVVFYTIPGGGHGWPGGSETTTGSFNTAQMIWDFFKAHPRGSG